MGNTIVKPKLATKIKRSPNPDDALSGYKDYIAIAYSGDLTARPLRPGFTGTIEGSAYVTATAATPAEAFGTEAVWGKLEVIVGSVKLNNKPLGNLKESSAETTELMFEVMDNADNEGYLKLLKSAPLDVVVEKNSGKMIYLGDADKNVYLKEYSRDTASDKGLISVTMIFDSLRPLYLPSGVILTYGT